jgi:hypothetical protein
LRCDGSFNYLVGPEQNRPGNREAERLDGNQIDGKLKLGRLLDWNIAGLCTEKDLVHLAGGTRIDDVRDVSGVPPIVSELARRSNNGPG